MTMEPLTMPEACETCGARCHRYRTGHFKGRLYCFKCGAFSRQED